MSPIERLKRIKSLHDFKDNKLVTLKWSENHATNQDLNSSVHTVYANVMTEHYRYTVQLYDNMFICLSMNVY